MGAGASAYGRAAFDFLAKLDQVTTKAEAIDSIERALGSFGAEYFAVATLPDPRQPFENAILAHKGPGGWFRRYLEEDYARVDPVLRLCYQSSVPFRWTEAPYDPVQPAKAERVMLEAADLGMREGFSVPIHARGRYQACFSISGPWLEIASGALPALHLMAHYAFEKLRQFDRVQPIPLRNPLSPREQEVLCWSAAGKTAADIGAILSITERTVTAHVLSACQKLGASNKTQAVALALRNRCIAL